MQRVSPATDPADLALVNRYLTDPAFSGASLFPAASYGAILDGRWVNAGAATVRGLDASAVYPVTVAGQHVDLDASASWLLDYEIQSTPTAPMVEVLDLVGYPTRLRARAGATWASGPWRLAAHWSHVSEYHDASGRTIGAWNTLDARLAWSGAVGPLGGVQASLSVQNLTNAPPPFYDDAGGFGFDAAQANILGRTVAFQLIKRW